jgi:hypothetical protein
VGVEPEGTVLRDFLLKMIRHWYRHPLSVTDTLPESSLVLVRYDDLVRDSEAAVQKIYRRFGFTIGPVLAASLRLAADRARHYRSRHRTVSRSWGSTATESNLDGLPRRVRSIRICA